jgi:hypothetical protein
VNVIQYDVRSLRTASNYGGANASFSPLYADGGTTSEDVDRTELVRVEIDAANGGFMTGTEELVAEYAVDLSFGITVADVTSTPTGYDPALVVIPPGDPQIKSWAGPTVGLSPGRGPQFVRAVRTRLSVRSRESDRGANVMASAGARVPGGSGLGPGVYRFSLSADGGAWARVRTVQAETALHNLANEVFQ